MTIFFLPHSEANGKFRGHGTPLVILGHAFSSAIPALPLSLSWYFMGWKTELTRAMGLNSLTKGCDVFCRCQFLLHEGLSVFREPLIYTPNQVGDFCFVFAEIKHSSSTENSTASSFSIWTLTVGFNLSGSKQQLETCWWEKGLWPYSSVLHSWWCRVWNKSRFEF